MRPKSVTLSATGNSSWIPLNWRQPDFKVGFGAKLNSTGNLTYTVQHTFDDIFNRFQTWSATRVTTTLTITQTNHGLTSNDWWQLDADSDWPGEYVVTVTNANVFTITVTDTGAASVVYGSKFAHKARVFNHPDIAAETASADGNYEFPPRACRLNCSVWAAGFVELTVIMAGG